MKKHDIPQRNERQTRTTNCKFSIRADGNAKRLEGYFAVFGSNYELWPGATESVDPHAFDEALSDDIRALIDHETRLVLGRTTAGTLKLTVDKNGLFGSILINEEDQDAMNLYARVQRGDVSQCSFGFDILEEDEKEQISANGKYTVHWTIKKVKLYEVSVVTFPAYKDTGITARKAEYDKSKKLRKQSFEPWKKQMLERLHRSHK